jgi:DNA excision repair protein ERCC-6
MSKIKLTEGEQKSRTCRRGGLDSLDFESSSEDDSSIDELLKLPPTFQTKQKPRASQSITRIVHTTSDEEEDSFQYAKEEISDDDTLEYDKQEHQKESDLEHWTFSSSKNEFSISPGIKDVKNPKLRVPAKLFQRLFDHQKAGVVWMAGLHCEKIGGLLGDDMGMGKTYMTLTYLGGLMRTKAIRNALVIAPLSVLRSWESEAHKVAKLCVPNVSIQVLSSGVAKATRSRRLQNALQW